MGAIWGGRWQATAHLLLWEKSMLVLCQIVSISSEYSCFTSDNPCCNTSLSDSTQKYALLFTLSCNSDYQGRCHGALKKKKEKVERSCFCFKECQKKSFLPAMEVFFTVNPNVSWH